MISARNLIRVLLALAVIAISPRVQAQELGPGSRYGLIGLGGGQLSAPLLATTSATNQSAPGYAFVGLPTTGWGYSTGTLFAINQGQRVFYASTTGAAWDVPLLQLDGSQTAPTYSFISAPNTGMWRSGGGNIVLGVSGTISFVVGTNFISIGNIASIQVANTTGLDTGGAPFTYTDLVVAETASATATTTQCGGHFNNAGALAHVDITTPVSAQIGCCLTIVDVGGAGGIGFIAQTGETIKLGTVASSTNRKVSTASAVDGNQATICKEKSGAWYGPTPTGTFTGS